MYRKHQDVQSTAALAISWEVQQISCSASVVSRLHILCVHEPPHFGRIVTKSSEQVSIIHPSCWTNVCFHEHDRRKQLKSLSRPQPGLILLDGMLAQFTVVGTAEDTSRQLDDLHSHSLYSLITNHLTLDVL